MNIDWSKAPEWANVRLKHTGCEDWCWASDYKENATANRGDGKRDFKLMACCWRVIAERPATWTGQGLPPVGTVCEWFSPIYGWLGGKVVGHDGTVTVISHNDGYTGCHPHEVRPTPTPEQLAEKARDKEIEAMKTVIYACLPRELWEDSIPACYALYDAGYRLTKQDSE